MGQRAVIWGRWLEVLHCMMRLPGLVLVEASSKHASSRTSTSNLGGLLLSTKPKGGVVSVTCNTSMLRLYTRRQVAHRGKTCSRRPRCGYQVQRSIIAW
jgi:hypothetical protein